MSDIYSDYDFTKIPFANLVRSGQRNLLYRDLFVVSWLLGRFCNYRCSYCWPYARADRPDHRPIELVTKTIDEIKRQSRARNFNSFHFSFSGGEPTLHPKYLDILSYLAQDVPNCNYHSLHMTSNISRPLAWFKNYVEVTRAFHRVSITASYHKEFAKRDLIRDKLLFLVESDVNVTINMVMVPSRYEELWEDAMYFHEAGLNVTLKPQSNATATQIVDGYTQDQLKKLRLGLPQRDYTRYKQAELKKNSLRPSVKIPQEIRNPASLEDHLSHDVKSVPPIFQVEFLDHNDKRWYLDQAERFNAFDFNKFLGWECSAGYRSIIIREPDGNIKRSYSCSDEPLGNIVTGFQLFPKPKICRTSSCVSSADSKIPKRRAGAQVPLFPGDTTYKQQLLSTDQHESSIVGQI